MKLPGDMRKLASAKLPVLVRKALARFKKLTGFTAVSALRTTPSEPEKRDLVPPVHPECARFLLRTRANPPCHTSWNNHLRNSRSTSSCQWHLCPVGLRCTCVPIFLGEDLMGLAKYVATPKVSIIRYRAGREILRLLLAQSCGELHRLLLDAEIRGLRGQVSRLRRAHRTGWVERQSYARLQNSANSHRCEQIQSALVLEVLDYLAIHFSSPTLSLSQVAAAVGKNEKYLSHLFAREVGERMRTYITTLRVHQACRLLLDTQLKIRVIAGQAGFTNVVQFRQTFRHATGVTATEYRRIFCRQT